MVSLPYVSSLQSYWLSSAVAQQIIGADAFLQGSYGYAEPRPTAKRRSILVLGGTSSMLRKFNKSRDVELLISGEVEAFTSSYPGSEVPINLVINRVRSIEKGRVSCTVLDEGGPKGYVISNQSVAGGKVETYVESIYLAPEARRKGKVELLLQSLLVRSAENVVSLDVSVSNSRAVASYQALGFEIKRFRMIRTFQPNDE